MDKTKEPLSTVIHVMNMEHKNFFLWVMMSEIISSHPFPWREEKDWSSEIYDANDKLVIKFPNTENSLSFIKFAEDFKKEKKDQNKKLSEELDIEIPE